MQLTSQQIGSYQKLYKTIFGRSISTQEALEQGIALVNLVSQITKKNEDENKDGRETQIR